jgi:hypothetical protein
MKINKIISKILYLSVPAICLLMIASISNGQKLKIMPLGNSITFGEDSSPDRQEMTTPWNCIAYRKALYDLLIEAGYTFDYVGSQRSGWEAGLPTNAVDSLDYTNNAGFPGIRPTQLTTLLRTGKNPYWGDDCELNGYGGCPQNYLTLFKPDVILLHIGTNQLTDYPTASTFRDSVNAMLNIIDAYEQSSGKTVPVFLAQIIKHGSGTIADLYDEYTVFYNDLLYNLVNSRSGDKLYIVDMENIPGFDYTKGADMFDDYHPNESGYAKMADTWFAHMDSYNFRAPVVSNIQNLTINEHDTYKTINLNNYVFDPQDPDDEITWSYTPYPSVRFNISIANGIATISSKNPDWNGSETITFKAEDSGHGSTPLSGSDAVIITSVAVNDTPVIQSQQPISLQEDTQVTILFSYLDVYDPDNSYPADFTLHLLPGSNYTVIGGNKVKPNANYYGTLTVPVYVNDGQVNSNIYNLTVTVTSVNDKPWLNIPANRTAFEGSLFSMTITAGDVDVGDVLVLSSLEKPSWLSFNAATGLLRGTPHNDDVGSHSVAIRVNDGKVNVDSVFFIEVENTNDNPVITSYPENTTIYSNEYFEYYITAEDSDVNDILTYSAVTLPSFLSFDEATHKLYGTPLNDDIGLHEVSLRVGDGTVFKYQDFDLQVEMKTHAPVITSSHVYTAVEDIQYIYALKATDIDNDVLTFTGIKIPDWLDFYPSGILIGTPENSDVGIHEVILSVTDGLYTVYDSFNIEVLNVNDPPVILGTSKILSTPKETPLELSISDLLVEDDDNIFPEDFSMKLYDGSNYTVIDYLVVPNTSFTGILDVNVEVDDGLDSATGQIPVYVGISAVNDQNQKEGSLMVYPVPATEKINFRFSKLSEDAVIKLFNSTLQPLKVLNVPARTEEFMIDIQDLPAGIIFYLVDDKHGFSSGSFIHTILMQQ